MKAKILASLLAIVIVSMFVIVAMPWMPSASAEGNFDVTRSFNLNPAEQGDTPTITIHITNNGSNQAKITWLGVHFDWQAEDVYHADVCEGGPVPIASGETKSFYIDFEVPSNIQTGSHTYHIKFYYDLQDGVWGGWNSYTWQSETLINFRVNERDRDGDGVPDSQDTFPDDPNEWKDTDGDGVGDNRDYYPNDPTKWEQEEDSSDDDEGLSIAGALCTLAIISIIVIVVVVLLKKKGQQPQPYQPPQQPYQPPQQPYQQPQQQPPQPYYRDEQPPTPPG